MLSVETRRDSSCLGETEATEPIDVPLKDLHKGFLPADTHMGHRLWVRGSWGIHSEKSPLPGVERGLKGDHHCALVWPPYRVTYRQCQLDCADPFHRALI